MDTSGGVSGKKGRERELHQDEKTRGKKEETGWHPKTPLPAILGT